MTTNQLLEALNHDKKNRFLKPFDRMQIHKEISNSLNYKPCSISKEIRKKITIENRIYKFF